jgi:FkbM family methyltransferase
MIENYKNILNNNLFVFVDIGSRAGLSPEWEQVKNLVQIVMFEPDEKEAKRLQSNSNNNELIIPKGVWSHNGVVNFNSTRNPSYSSVLKPNKEVLEGSFYYSRNFYKIEKTSEIEVNILEDVLNDYQIKSFDFMKIDIQGAEHHIFDSIKNWNSVSGIHTEAYGSMLYEEGSNIATTLKTMYDKDFEIYDLSTIADAPIVEINGQKVFSKKLLNARPKSGYKSRPMVYDLLLFKNKLGVLNSNDKIYIRKMIFVLCIYKYFDYALYLIIKSSKKKLFSQNETDIIIRSIKSLHKKSLSKIQRFKEIIKAPSYDLRKR